jgi:hypothetical protein
MSFWDGVGSYLKGGGTVGWLAKQGRNLVTGAVDEETGGTKSAEQAGQAQRGALDQAMKRLQEFSQQHYKNRMADLDKTMSFYGPAERYLQSIYGPQQPPGGGGMPSLPPMNGMGGMPPKRGLMG